MRVNRRDARTKAIIDSARDVFLEQGYAATSMSDIARRAGGSKATLWACFPSKKSLFIGVVEDTAVRTYDKICELVGESNCAEINLHALASDVASFLCSPEVVNFARLIVSEAARFPELGRIFNNCAVVPLQNRLSTYLGKAMADGQLWQGDPNQAASELISIIQRPQILILFNVGQDVSNESATIDYVTTSINSFLRAYSAETK